MYNATLYFLYQTYSVSNKKARDEMLYNNELDWFKLIEL